MIFKNKNLITIVIIVIQLKAKNLIYQDILNFYKIKNNQVIMLKITNLNNQRKY